MNRLIPVLLMAALSVAAAEGPKLKVLIVTGGHGFQREPFFQVFTDNPGIAFTEAKHTRDADAYERDDLLSHDVIVLYDMPKTITEPQKEKFLALFKKGVGVVVMHHALVSYQHWPEYERIIGGRYPEEDGKSGAVTEQVGWQHDVDVPVVVTAKDHPITKGIKDFLVRDEIYWGFRVGADVNPLITTTHPKSGKPLMWTRAEGKSRLVYLQLGHGPSAFKDENFRELVARSIRWVAASGGDRGWTQLFDGKTLDGWEQRGGKAKYEVRDGEIIGSSVPNTPNSFLCTTRDFANFVLELEFKVDPGLNSGVQIRSHAFDKATEFQGKDRTIKVPARRVHGLQVEIDPSARAWTGGVQEEGGRAWLNDLKNNEAARGAFKPGDWNRFRIECRGPAIKTWINGIPAADLQDDRVNSGFIALQVHGVGPSEETRQVRFRNIRLLEL
jgi:type 1 glutamine amidotransferase